MIEEVSGALRWIRGAARHERGVGASRRRGGAWRGGDVVHSHFLDDLLHGELEHRYRRMVETSLRFARFPHLKRLADFDFSAQPSLDRRLIDELSTGRFLHDGRDIVLLRPPGVGKTHLRLVASLVAASAAHLLQLASGRSAGAFGLTTFELGHRVSFSSAIELAHKLTRAVDNNRLHRGDEVPHAAEAADPR